ncbi:flavodoxin family protein [Aurantiacibacter aquimixticola]|uniref:Flavodoxin family protein n=1 Tax=Aurantiacibacter aquimixticola TaxID=1958945 RepID=A0A419RQK5_9SPHN|nr:NAD(P)H-dependent oxidoreductase [Aurantiacibacter aquimixticola]RJY08102.1 flavodoxin family protein [Aurantiacibacter aquimixticola]
MKTLLIVWYSHTGGSRQLAEAARDGANEASGVDVRFLEAEDAQSADLLEADGYIFACPENLAAIAGVMKAFFDRTYYEVLGHIEGRPYAAMICAGSDGSNAQAQLERIATGWRLKRVADTKIVNVGAQTKEAILADKTIDKADLSSAHELGQTLAAGLEMGMF